MFESNLLKGILFNKIFISQPSNPAHSSGHLQAEIYRKLLRAHITSGFKGRSTQMLRQVLMSQRKKSTLKIELRGFRVMTQTPPDCLT